MKSPSWGALKHLSHTLKIMTYSWRQGTWYTCFYFQCFQSTCSVRVLLQTASSFFMAKKHEVQKQVRSNIAYVHMFCQICLFGGKANFGEQLCTEVFGRLLNRESLNSWEALFSHRKGKCSCYDLLSLLWLCFFCFHYLVAGVKLISWSTICRGQRAANKMLPPCKWQMWSCGVYHHPLPRY